MGVPVNVIEQDVDRTLGVFDGYDISPLLPNSPALFRRQHGAATRTTARRAFGADLNQLIGERFSVGAGFRVTRSELRTTFTELADRARSHADLEDEATLQELMSLC